MMFDILDQLQYFFDGTKAIVLYTSGNIKS
jgi:hypothetical protein